MGGGDGTIAAAAQRLAGTGVPLGILPLGTMNLLARDLGLPTGLEAAAAALAHGHARAVDVVWRLEEERALEPKKLVIIKGGKHFDAYTEPGLSQAAPPAVEWFEQHLMGDE